MFPKAQHSYGQLLHSRECVYKNIYIENILIHYSSMHSANFHWRLNVHIKLGPGDKKSRKTKCLPLMSSVSWYPAW